MERRGFLRGLLGGVTSAGLIVAANPADIAAFAGPLVKDAPLLLDTPVRETKAAEIGEHLYNARGEVVAIVTEIRVDTPSVETTLFGEASSTYIPGVSQVEIRAQGIGSLEWSRSPARQFPRLRGR